MAGPNRSRRFHVQGFTLAELTLAIALIAILMAFLLPSLNNAREVARKHADASNVSQLANAVGQYANSYQNEVPQGFASSGCHYYAALADNRAGQWMKYGTGGWAKGYTGLALLYQSGIVTNAQLFYSPTAAQFTYRNATRGWNKNGNQEPTSGAYILSHFYYRYSMSSNNRKPIGVLKDCGGQTADAFIGDINKLRETDNAFIWGSYKTQDNRISLRDGYNIGHYDGAVAFLNAYKRYPGQSKSWADELKETSASWKPPLNMWWDYTDCWGYGSDAFHTAAADHAK